MPTLVLVYSPSSCIIAIQTDEWNAIDRSIDKWMDGWIDGRIEMTHCDLIRHSWHHYYLNANEFQGCKFISKNTHTNLDDNENWNTHAYLTKLGWMINIFTDFRQVSPSFEQTKKNGHFSLFLSECSNDIKFYEIINNMYKQLIKPIQP